MRSGSCLGGIRWASLLLVAFGAQGSDDPVYHSDVRLVKVNAYVFDRNTKAPISGLRAADFQLRDGDERREIAYFADDSGPLDLVLLFDVSGTMRELLPKVAQTAAGALSALQDSDRAGVIAFGKTTAVTQDLTKDVDSVVEGIRSVFGTRVGLDTDINQAAWAAADYLHRRGGAAKRAILVMTDNMQETRVPDALVDEQLFQADAVLDALLVRGRVVVPHITHSGVLHFAARTGGEVIEGDHPAARLGEMIQRIKARYSIHFRPVETASSQQRSIRLELSPDARRRYPNAVVRARTSYFPHSVWKPKPEIPHGHRVS